MTNNEIREYFVLALEDVRIDIITNTILNSGEMLEETLKCNYKHITDVFDRYHQELESIFKEKEDEDLGIIVQALYYKARKFYIISSKYDYKEETTTISFIPRDNTNVPFIICIKNNDNPHNIINQIKNKGYVDTLGNYHGKIMLMGITRDSKLLKHDTKIETIEI